MVSDKPKAITIQPANSPRIVLLCLTMSVTIDLSQRYTERTTMFTEILNHPYEVLKAMGILVSIAGIGIAVLLALYYLLREEEPKRW